MIRRDLEQRLRSVLRQFEDLVEPICHMTHLPTQRHGIPGPRYFVHLRPREKPRHLKGLVIGSLSISLSHEAIRNQAEQLALTIWHLHDPIKEWLRATQSPGDVVDLCKGVYSIAICADLTNLTKHRRNENLSGRDPRFGQVVFDTSQSGVLNFVADGGRKEYWLCVTEPHPIPFKVTIDLDTGHIDDACAVFDDAIRNWVEIIHALAVLDPSDGESARVLERLDELVKANPRVIQEMPQRSAPP